MISGGKKVQKPQKTKFRRDDDYGMLSKPKKKHHDKSTYRLLRQEKEDVVLIQRQA